MANLPNRGAESAYGVAVVGGGHAGCEAALAAARMGRATLLLTGNLDSIALMPCNPSIGGPAKGHLVREVDALGGEMGRAIDRTFIQIRMLNTGKGPAVQAPRAQADKRLYGLAMKHVVEREPNLDLRQGLVVAVTPVGDEQQPLFVVETDFGVTYRTRCVVLTTGTFLSGRLVAGNTTTPGGRAGEGPAVGLSASLRRLGFRLGRLKTGTPPRVDARSIDFSQTEEQPGSGEPIFFSFTSVGDDLQPASAVPGFLLEAPNPVYPRMHESGWRPQLPCYLVRTTPRTHEIIRSGLDRSPLFTGVIEGIGPRYCPSIEDKIVRFAEKESHLLFLEPEGWQTGEVYVQGANTSLPPDIQEAMLRSIPGLEEARLVRFGYAVEYDFVPPDQTQATLEAKRIPGLFFAGQINGTSGYEEAAGQGLVAGVNAALRARPGACRRFDVPADLPPDAAQCIRTIQSGQPFVLPRSLAYIGVMIDDLTTSELTEPYRLLTSRAEYRLLLRHANADLRLTPIGFALGIADEARYVMVVERLGEIRRLIASLSDRRVIPGRAERLEGLGLPRPAHGAAALEYLRRQDVDWRAVADLAGEIVPAAVAQHVEIEVKYEAYIAKQQQDVERVHRLDGLPLPPDLDYAQVHGLRIEAREKLEKVRPLTLGQAGRILGVTPADVATLLIHLRR